MLGTGDDSITRRRAVVQRARQGAAKQALRQGRLNATASLIGALAATDGAGPDDYRRFFMAWQATRVLRPSPIVFLPAAALTRKHLIARGSELKLLGVVTNTHDGSVASVDDDGGLWGLA